MLISRYSLDCKPYNTKDKKITWAKCTLRTWLNKNFLNDAFSQKEQKAILTTKVDNSKKQGYQNTDGGSNTKDKVFLLSYTEVTQYFPLD